MTSAFLLPWPKEKLKPKVTHRLKLVLRRKKSIKMLQRKSIMKVVRLARLTAKVTAREKMPKMSQVDLVNSKQQMPHLLTPKSLLAKNEPNRSSS